MRIRNMIAEAPLGWFIFWTILVFINGFVIGVLL